MKSILWVLTVILGFTQMANGEECAFKLGPSDTQVVGATVQRTELRSRFLIFPQRSLFSTLERDQSILSVCLDSDLAPTMEGRIDFQNGLLSIETSNLSSRGQIKCFDSPELCLPFLLEFDRLVESALKTHTPSRDQINQLRRTQKAASDFKLKLADLAQKRMANTKLSGRTADLAR